MFKNSNIIIEENKNRKKKRKKRKKRKNFNGKQKC